MKQILNLSPYGTLEEELREGHQGSGLIELKSLSLIVCIKKGEIPRDIIPQLFLLSFSIIKDRIIISSNIFYPTPNHILPSISLCILMFK
jgi:hypothetical protein